jgi:hypothetical protein
MSQKTRLGVEIIALIEQHLQGQKLQSLWQQLDSLQQAAQRLGRILRPKPDGRSARFYTLVSLRTCEEDFARHRQLFLYVKK